MKIKFSALLIGAIFLVSACKKNEYSNTSTATQPVFSFSGEVGGSPVTIQAGVGNYYLSTSYAKDANGVYNFTGDFMTQGCSGSCPNSLQIYFKDSCANPSGNVMTAAHINRLINNGYYSFSTPAGESNGYYVSFIDFMNNAPISYSWNFGDGQTGNTHNPIHYYARPGIYMVSVTLNSGSCASTDTSMVIVGQVGGFFSAFSNGFTLLTTTFANASYGIPPYTYLWDFGDGHSSTLATPTYTYAFAGVYRVTSSVTDATGFTNIQTLYEATQGYNSSCAAGFFESFPPTPEGNPNNCSDIGVKWYDASGNLWQSENNNQHTNSLFKVTSVSDYMNNSQAQPVKMITAQIRCELYNGTDSIPFKGTAIFGVAHY